MKVAKRIFLFVTVNILILTTLSVLASILGVRPYIEANGINYNSLLIFCVVWGFGGAFIALAISRITAKWMMGVKLINDETRDLDMLRLRQRVFALAQKAGLEKMPEVGYYESEEINAFATGPSRNRSLVAVSTGLLQHMDDDEVEGVLAHEVAHIANGDMVTMTLVQGVVNALVMFIARIIAFFASQFVAEDKRNAVQFGVVLVSEIALGVLGMIVVSYFSRAREFRADAGAATLSSKQNMIAALQKLKKTADRVAEADDQPAIASLKISGKRNWLKLFSTHPELDERIARLRDAS